MILGNRKLVNLLLELTVVSQLFIHNNLSGSFGQCINYQKLAPLATISQKQRVKCNIPHSLVNMQEKRKGSLLCGRLFSMVACHIAEQKEGGALDNSHHSRIPSFIHYILLQLHMPSARSFLRRVEKQWECLTLSCWQSLLRISQEGGQLKPQILC